MAPFEEAFQSACDPGFLPRVILIAADKAGSFTYTNPQGCPLVQARERRQAAGSGHRPDYCLALLLCSASSGLFDLDDDVTRVLPEPDPGKEIILNFDDEAKKVTVRPKDKPVNLRTWDESGAKTVLGFDLTNGSVDCLGGGGLFGTARDFMHVLQAVLGEDDRLLKKESYAILFSPQLSDASTEALAKLLRESNYHNQELAWAVPLDGRKSWSVGGLVSLDAYSGWMGNGTWLWSGLPNLRWVSWCPISPEFDEADKVG
ncbi:hypothetical protein MMC30_001075 [Trapelia coarctata]|nr:hypothetical protein [Trapelia coarctata]